MASNVIGDFDESNEVERKNEFIGLEEIGGSGSGKYGRFESKIRMEHEPELCGEQAQDVPEPSDARKFGLVNRPTESPNDQSHVTSEGPNSLAVERDPNDTPKSDSEFSGISASPRKYLESKEIGQAGQKMLPDRRCCMLQNSGSFACSRESALQSMGPCENVLQEEIHSSRRHFSILEREDKFDMNTCNHNRCPRGCPCSDPGYKVVAILKPSCPMSCPRETIIVRKVDPCPCPGCCPRCSGL